MKMKISETIVGVAMCVLLAMGALSIAMLPSGNVAQAIAPMGSPLPTQPAPKKGCVAPNGANIRKGPGERFRVVGTIPAGGRFSVRGRGHGWVYGASSYGRGWVSRALLKCS